MSPLIGIVGETASGKSALAMYLAERFNGEIICADSRTIYRGMDIGTAKPSLADQAKVPHHLIDIVNPDHIFTVADFQANAKAAISDITNRGKLPIIVGGTGLYIDALIYDFTLRPTVDPAIRTSLEGLSVDELQNRIRLRGLLLPVNDRNPRHLIRTLETGGAPMQRQPLRANTFLLGFQVDKAVLDQRIALRVVAMIAAGLEAEARKLFAAYGEDCRALHTIGYQEFLELPEVTDVAAMITLHTRQYAKRQRAWFKRNKSIHWCREQIEVVDLITTFLNK